MSSNAADVMPFAKLVGVQVEEASKDKIRAHVIVREDLCTTGAIMHGGAIMAFADALGAIGAFMTLPEGAKGTTTIESKTNFLGPAPLGKKVIGETVPIKIGRTL
jgi:uncharacterized protein (TIGR00369 family)